MKTAIVTGATKGIGLAIARMLLSEGYHVVVTYAHDTTSAEKCREELSAISSNFTIVRADQADKASMREFVEYVKREHSGIEAIVCNAGTTLRCSLEEITDEDWERMMQVNLNSNLYLIRDHKRGVKAETEVTDNAVFAVLSLALVLLYKVKRTAVF